jgi:hypothetical protein
LLVGARAFPPIPQKTRKGWGTHSRAWLALLASFSLQSASASTAKTAAKIALRKSLNKKPHLNSSKEVRSQKLL